MELVVGIGEYIISDKEDDIIKTFALASCVGVTAYSPKKKVAGMVHLALPTPLDENDHHDRPYYFAETGIPLLFNMICNKYGCLKDDLQICIFGGADSIRDNDIFKIGKRNIEAVESTLSNMGLRVHKADLSGNESRTLIMEVKTGKVKVQRQPINI